MRPSRRWRDRNLFMARGVDAKHRGLRVWRLSCGGEVCARRQFGNMLCDFSRGNNQRHVRSAYWRDQGLPDYRRGGRSRLAHSPGVLRRRRGQYQYSAASHQLISLHPNDNARDARPSIWIFQGRAIALLVLGVASSSSVVPVADTYTYPKSFWFLNCFRGCEAPLAAPANCPIN